MELAQKFVESNIHHFYLSSLILCREFFTKINVPTFLQDVKIMFLPLTVEMSSDALEI